MNKNVNEMDVAVVKGVSGGVHVVDGPLTTSLARENASGLLLNEVEQRVAVVKPMSTPVDQITRMIGSRPAQSMVVDYYTVDTKGTVAKVTSFAEVAGKTHAGCQVYKLVTTNDRLLAPTETFMMPAVSGDTSEASDSSQVPAVFYVVERTSDGTGLHVICANGAKAGGVRKAAGVEAGLKLIRMGRAASELDMQTDQFESLPRKESNYCQIFKTQIEQSTLMSLSRKETGWTLTDQEEAALMDMRLGMEKSFIFGCKARIADGRTGDETLMTRGIWQQAPHKYSLPETVDHSELMKLMREAFTGTAAGSRRKILLAGSGLIETLSNMDGQRVWQSTERVTRWGIDFNEICSKFGTLYVIHSEVFDDCGHSRDGMIIDPEYITKYVHVPMNVEHLDLKRSGVRNVDALVITEASCVVLRHPDVHIRVVSE